MNATENQRLKHLSDMELMTRYQQEHSADAFDELFRRYRGNVMGYAVKKCANKQVAEDVLQEVFFKFHRSRHLYDGRIPVSAWLFTIVRSVIVDGYRRNRKHEYAPLDSDSVQAQEPMPVESVDLSVLNKDEEALVRARFFGGESFADLSKQLNKSEATLRKRLSRIVMKLRAFNRRKDHG